MSDNWSGVLFSMVLVAFIGGCTYVITDEGYSKLMKMCLDAEGYEWRSGDCLRVSQ